MESSRIRRVVIPEVHLSQRRQSFFLGIYQQHSVFCHLIKGSSSVSETPILPDLKRDHFSEDILKSQPLMFVCKTGII